MGGFTCLEGSGRLNGPRLGWVGLAGWLAGWLAEVWKFGCLDLRTEAGLAGWLAGSLAGWLAEVWMFGGILMLGCLEKLGCWDVWRCLLIYILFFFGCLEVQNNMRSPPRSTTMGRRIKSIINIIITSDYYSFLVKVTLFARVAGRVLSTFFNQ